MSRHRVPHDKWEVNVGWDRPMQTFFLQAHHLPVGEGDLVHWLGGKPGALPSTAALYHQARELGINIPSTLLKTLADDKLLGRM